MEADCLMRAAGRKRGWQDRPSRCRRDQDQISWMRWISCHVDACRGKRASKIGLRIVPGSD